LLFSLLINRNSPGHKDLSAIEEAVFQPVKREGPVNQNEIISESSGLVQNARIFRNALDFSNVKLREIMVPRTEIEAVSISSSPEQIKEVFIATKFSRILVYRDTIDTVTGYIEVRDIYVNPVSIEPVIRKITIVPETMPASRLLKMFVNEKMNIALVVDEFGGTSGMVTTEDLLEEIVGDIEDEHDTTDLIEKPVRKDEFIFSGRLEIDYLNEKYHFNLPEQSDYETIAGMILFYHGSIPGNNEIIRIRNIVIKILRASTTKIEVVRLKVE
jgi:CBS domain containing-hemolysin-like protein